MSVVYTDIQNNFSEFASTDSSLITRYIAKAEQRIDEDVYGSLYDQAVEYLTAHLLSVEANGSASGQISKEKVGDLELNYDNPSTSSGENLTSYYQEFKNISKRVPKGPLVLTI